MGFRFGATVEDMLGPRRLKPLVFARGVVSAILHERGFSTTKIGRMLNRDHSSIVHYLREVGPVYCRNPIHGALIREVLDWERTGAETMELYRQHLAQEKVCNPVLQPVVEEPQQRKGTKMLHPEETEKQIAEALKAEKLRNVEAIWNGDIICAGEPAVFDIYRDGEKTDMYVYDEGPRFTLYYYEDRCTHEVASTRSYAKLAKLLRETLPTQKAA